MRRVGRGRVPRRHLRYGRSAGSGRCACGRRGRCCSPSGRPVVGKCPRCGAEVTESKTAISARRSCKFGLWRDNRFLAAKKISLTKKMASSLLTQGRAYASGIYSEKTGKTYDAFIVLEDDGARSSYKLDFTK